jgi:16S rRNA pseudouridine516 synthase
VEVDQDLDPALVPLFASGSLRLPDESDPCLPATLTLVGPRIAHLDLVEGRYHQVRRMFASQGFRVISLHRSHFGALDLGDLPAGQWRAVVAESI